MILNKSLPEILELIGHDGSEIRWPDYPEPTRRRGFTTQEFIDVAFECKYYMLEILQPEVWDGHNIESVVPVTEFPRGRTFEDRILYYMAMAIGLIIGRYNAQSKHMVAWDHTTGQIYDPDGRVYSFFTDSESIIVESFLPVFEIKS